MHFATLLVISLTLINNICAKKPTNRHPSHHPSHPTYSMSPSTTNPTVPTSSPSWIYTPEEYYYIASIYYGKAKFDYDNYPHFGPAFYHAQEDQAAAKYYHARGQEEAQELANKTDSYKQLYNCSCIKINT